MSRQHPKSKNGVAFVNHEHGDQQIIFWADVAGRWAPVA